MPDKIGLILDHDRLQRERDEAYALLRECREALLVACTFQRQRGQKKRVELIGRIEALFPDRLALDKALADRERQAATGVCGVCGRQDRLRIGFGGRAFWDGEKMTPWMCPECSVAYEQAVAAEKIKQGEKQS